MGNILTRPPVNGCWEEEVNTSSPESDWNQEIFAAIYALFYFISSDPLFALWNKLAFKPRQDGSLDISVPFSQSVGFPNKVDIPCPNDLSLHLLVCYAVHSISLNSVTKFHPRKLPIEGKHLSVVYFFAIWQEPIPIHHLGGAGQGKISILCW